MARRAAIRRRDQDRQSLDEGALSKALYTSQLTSLGCRAERQSQPSDSSLPPAWDVPAGSLRSVPHRRVLALVPPGFLNLDWRSGCADSNPSGFGVLLCGSATQVQLRRTLLGGRETAARIQQPLCRRPDIVRLNLD